MRDAISRWQRVAAVTVVVAVGVGLARVPGMGLGSGLAHVRAAEAHAVALQQPTPTTTTSGKSFPPIPDDPLTETPDGMKARQEAQHERAWNDDRHKRLVADTDKLLVLATELKEDVDKSSRNELSLKVIQKAGEIEKLSHDVKERMKN